MKLSSLRLRTIIPACVLSVTVGCGMSEPAINDFLFLPDGQVLIALYSGKQFRVDRGGTGVLVGRLERSASGSSAFSIARLVNGSNASIWGTYVYQEYALPYEVAVSSDGGANVSSIIFENINPAALIAHEQMDPILLAYDGQLWMRDVHSDPSPASFRKLGNPIPTGDAESGIMCRGEFIVIGIGVPDRLPVPRIWSSGDEAQTWNADFDLDFGDFASGLSCTPNDEVWCITVNGQVLFSSERGIWNRLVDLRASPFPQAGSIDAVLSEASDEAAVFIAGFIPTGREFVLRVDRAGFVSELPFAPVATLKVDSNGTLWGAGNDLFRFNDGSGMWERVWRLDD